MFDYSKVDFVVESIVKSCNPKMVVIFGSVARKEAKDDSDIDILVIMDKMDDRKEVYRNIAKNFRGLGVAVDLFISTVEKINNRMDDTYSFAHEIMSTGEIVYAQ